MNKLISVTVIAAAAMFSFAAHADQTVQATRTHSSVTVMMDSTPFPDETILYTCSSLEDKTTSLLKNLGATNVKVNCMGNGDDDQPTFAPVVSAEFDSAHVQPGAQGVSVVAEWQTVTLHDVSDCNTIRQLLVGVAPKLEVRNVTADECRTSDEAYKFQLDTLVEKK